MVNFEDLSEMVCELCSCLKLSTQEDETKKDLMLLGHYLIQIYDDLGFISYFLSGKLKIAIDSSKLDYIISSLNRQRLVAKEGNPLLLVLESVDKSKNLVKYLVSNNINIRREDVFQYTYLLTHVLESINEIEVLLNEGQDDGYDYYD